MKTKMKTRESSQKNRMKPVSSDNNNTNRRSKTGKAAADQRNVAATMMITSSSKKPKHGERPFSELVSLYCDEIRISLADHAVIYKCVCF